MLSFSVSLTLKIRFDVFLDMIKHKKKYFTFVLRYLYQKTHKILYENTQNVISKILCVLNIFLHQIYFFFELCVLTPNVF